MAYTILPDEPAPSSFNKSSLHRIPAQIAKGAVSQTVGLPGDVFSLINEFIAKPLTEKITGKPGNAYEETALGKILPTSETHKKNLEEGIPYLKPLNQTENFISDIASDTVGLFLPGTAIKKTGMLGSSLAKSLGTSLAANSAGNFIQDLTGDEKKGAYTKLGSMFLFSALSRPSAQKEVGKLYKSAEQLLPADAEVSAKGLKSNLQKLKSDILQKRTAKDLSPSEKFVIDQSDTILRQVKGGKANVKTLQASLRSLNENLQKAVYEAPDKGSRTRARKLATNINRYVNQTLAEYGKKNPSWWKQHRAASEAFGTLEQSKFFSNYIQNNFRGGSVAPVLLHIFGIGTGVTGAIAPYQTAKIIYQIAKSPTLAKHYAKVVSAAATEDATLMNKELRKLDAELKKGKNSNNTLRYQLLDG